MILSHRAALGGVQLDSVDPRIMVKGVATQAPREQEITAKKSGDGLRYIETRRESLEVTVRFGLRIFDDDMDEREELMEAVMAWANNLPGWLTTTQKPGRRLWVEKVTQPAPGDPYEWTNEYTLTFRAMAIPYWMDSTATSATLTSGNNNSKTMNIPGTMPTPMEMELTNSGSQTMNEMEISVAEGDVFYFESLGLGVGEKLVISHTEDGILQIRIKGTNDEYRDALDKRSAGSTDELMVPSGNNKTITITAGGAVTGTISCRGRYR